MATLDFDVCDGKSFRDLCKEILDRSQSKKDQLDTLISEVRGCIKGPNDVQAYLPRIKELLEVGIKNDDQMVKLASVLQKLQSTQIETGDGTGGMLSDEEKEQLLKNSLKEEIKTIKNQIDTPLDVTQKVVVPNIIS